MQEYLLAVRANRQLATALGDQGLNEQAAHFAYRAKVCQRVVLRRQGKLLGYGGSLLLDGIAGYGYKPLRSLLTYLLMIIGFAGIYYLLRDAVSPSLSPLDALVFSVTSFHGRGFAPSTQTTSLHSPLTLVAAVEAVVGLVIEITFIATFTQRFFNQ